MTTEELNELDEAFAVLAAERAEMVKGGFQRVRRMESEEDNVTRLLGLHARALIRSAKRERLLQAEVEAWREQDAAWYGDHEGTTSDYIDQAAKADEKVDATRAALDLFDQENPA